MDKKMLIHIKENEIDIVRVGGFPQPEHFTKHFEVLRNFLVVHTLKHIDQRCVKSTNNNDKFTMKTRGKPTSHDKLMMRARRLVKHIKEHHGR